MNAILRWVLIGVGGLFAAAPAAGQERVGLREVPFTDVRLEDSFWTAWQRAARERLLPHNLRMCDETGRLANFDKAAGKAEGKYEGYFFNDSDVYKMIEGAAYLLSLERDSEIERQVDALIARIAAAQQPDGYLNSYFSLTPDEQPWSNIAVRHELYCAGHLLEAGLAYEQATGKRSLLDVAIRFVDLIEREFGPGRRTSPPGHAELELALIRLYERTGELRYLKLTQFFVEQRGRANGRELYGEYSQDHKPLVEQREIVGHAVRATYFYCAATDLARLGVGGEYVEPLNVIWRDVTDRKMYVTGGIGSSRHNEGFTVAYDLPNETAYAETCAGIGLLFWNHRLNLLNADARYADVLERSLYNGILSGLSLDGERFFYVNPLASRGEHHRQPWFACACCPPNLLRLVPTVGGYAYAVGPRSIYVNQFMAGTATIDLDDLGAVEIMQQTRYPWEGSVRLTLRPAKAAEFALFVRIPGWSRGATLRINGEPVGPLQMERGYARLARQWKPGDLVELDLPMPVERIESHPRVQANRGRVALQRGPIVYCLEGVDHGGHVRNILLPRGAELRAEWRSELLGGVTVLRGRGVTFDVPAWEDELYRASPQGREIELTAIPYYAWDNREPGEMVVWLPETAAAIEPGPVGWLRPSASHCWRADTVDALRDRVEPKDSSDGGIARFTWWPRRGGTEWVQYDFDEARRVSAVEVYWFDDSRKGAGCGPPASWKLLYRAGDEWREVSPRGEYGTALDRFNRVEFEPVQTTGLRIEAELGEGLSAGILEWRVVAAR